MFIILNCLERLSLSVTKEFRKPNRSIVPQLSQDVRPRSKAKKVKSLIFYNSYFFIKIIVLFDL